MDSAKNVRLIIPFKKFDMVRVKNTAAINKTKLSSTFHEVRVKQT